MSSPPGNLKTSLAGGRRTRRNCSRRRLGLRRGRAPRSFNNGGLKPKCSKVVSAKLETLKSLINPSHTASGTTLKPDELFQETADYIVLLRTQVVILQRLVEFYGSSENENIAAVS